jgi:UDP-glucose 4-epimerase
LRQRTRVARLFNVIGPRETNPHLLPETIAQLHSTPLGCVKLRLGNLTTVRDYVDVRDVGRALLSMALGVRSSARDVPFALNFGGAQGVSGEQLVRSVAEVADREVAVSTDRTRLRTSDRPRLVADIRRARSALGWSPTIALKQSLRDALAHPHAVSYGRVPNLFSA